MMPDIVNVCDHTFNEDETFYDPDKSDEYLTALLSCYLDYLHLLRALIDGFRNQVLVPRRAWLVHEKQISEFFKISLSIIIL
jgi:hypothetical protein